MRLSISAKIFVGFVVVLATFGGVATYGAVTMRRLGDELRLVSRGHAARNSAKTKHHRRFANNLLKIWPALWTFASHPSVEPTNNPAERALRAPVIHRKLSHGTRTDDGERFAERALSAAATCRQQGRSLFAYLVELITAHTRGDPLPALV